MATFTDIYKKQLKTKGILSSLGAAAVGRAKERMDPRNILFGGKGMFAATGQKIFGEGYKAIPSKKIEKESDGLNGEVLNLLKQNNNRLSVIGKNTMPLRAIARDMNVMRQNTVKLVKLAGGEASTKADMFFRKQGEEETAYENALKKEDKKPQPVEKEKGDKKSFLEGLFAPLVSIATTIAAKMSKVLTPVLDLFTMIKGVFSSPLKILLSLGGKVLDVAGATGKALMRLMFRALLPFLANPVVLGLLGAAGIAWMLYYLRGEYDEGKNRYLELAKKKKEGKITKEEEEEMRRIQTPNYRKAAVDQLGGYDPVTGTYQGGKTQAGLQRAEQQRQVNYRDLATEQLIAEGNRNPTLKDIHDRAEKLRKADEASRAQSSPDESEAERRRLASRPAPTPAPTPAPATPASETPRTTPVPVSAAPMTAADFQRTDKDTTPVAIPSVSSPNQPALSIKQTDYSTQTEAMKNRGMMKKVVGAVFHHTGGDSVSGAIATLKQRKLSYHFIIDKKGNIQQLLPDGAVGFHTTESDKNGIKGIGNSNTIGIALAAADDKSVTPEQIQAAQALNNQLAQKFGYDPKAVFGHGEISTQKSGDEGKRVVTSIRSNENAPSLAAASPGTGARVAEGSTQIADARMSTDGSSTTVTNVKNQRASGQQRQTQQAVASPHNSDMNGLLTSVRLALG